MKGKCLFSFYRHIVTFHCPAVFQVAKALLEAGAAVSPCARDGWTPLHQAVSVTRGTLNTVVPGGQGAAGGGGGRVAVRA